MHQQRTIRKRKLQQLQKHGLDDLAKTGEPKFTDTFFTYTSGEIGLYYIQSAAILQNPRAFKRSVNAQCTLIKGTVDLKEIDFVSGGETRDWIFSYAVGMQLGLPVTSIYKEGKMIGYTDLKGKTGIHVADLNNEGSSIRDLWVPAVEKKGGLLTHTYFFVDRLESGVQAIEELGLHSYAVTPFDGKAWQYLQRKKVITPEQRAALDARMEDKQAWGHAALQEHTGQLADMLRSTNKKEVLKGEKILNVGYPEIKDELLQKIETEFGYTHNFNTK